MAGPSAKINNIDNYHNLDFEAFAAPGVVGNKVCGPSDPKPCQLNTWTASHLIYSKTTKLLDTGGEAQGALQMESKLLSSSDIQFHAG